MNSETIIRLADGKYAVLHTNGTGLRAFRHGMPWRDLTGDGLVLALVHRIEELYAERQRAREGVTPAMIDTICRAVIGHDNYGYEHQDRARAALQSIAHLLPSEPAEGHNVRVLSHDGECETVAKWEHQENAYVTQDAIRAPRMLPSAERIKADEGAAEVLHEIASYWRPLLQWALGTIAELGDGEISGEDAVLYSQAKYLAFTHPPAQAAQVDRRVAIRLAQYGAEYAYRHKDWLIEPLQDGCEEHIDGWIAQASDAPTAEPVAQGKALPFGYVQQCVLDRYNSGESACVGVWKRPDEYATTPVYLSATKPHTPPEQPAGRQGDVEGDGMCNVDNPERRCVCREEFGRRVCEPAAPAGVPDTLDGEELAELAKTVAEFNDCETTETPQHMLMRWAEMGLLECEYFVLTKKGQDLLAAAPPAPQGVE